MATLTRPQYTQQDRDRFEYLMGTNMAVLKKMLAFEELIKPGRDGRSYDRLLFNK